MLLATSFCYLFYYTGRQNLGWAVPGLRSDVGLSATQIGWISGLGLAAYGAGQVASGHLGDRVGARRLVALGAALSCGLNWLTSFGQSFWGLLIPWAMNGLAQSMGFAPASRIIADWWGPRERGRAYGIFTFAAGFSSVLTFATAMLVLAALPWRWVFRLPVLLMLVGAAVLVLLVPDRPDASASAQDAASPKALAAKEGLGQVLRDRRFVFACLGFGFTNWARLGLLVWVPAHFLGGDWRAGSAGAFIPLALPVGMALGALVAGVVADRVLGGDHVAVVVLFLLTASALTLVLYFVSADDRALGVGLLFLVGFLVFGPATSFTALSTELSGPQVVAGAIGIMNAIAYAAAALGDVVVGAVIDATGRTASIFPVCAGACLLGAGATALVRRRDARGA